MDCSKYNTELTINQVKMDIDRKKDQKVIEIDLEI